MFFLRQKEEQEEERGNKEHKEEHIERQAGQLAAANDALKKKETTDDHLEKPQTFPFPARFFFSFPFCLVVNNNRRAALSSQYLPS